MSDNPKYLRISAELTDDAFVKAVYLASALEIESLERERDKLADLLREVMACGVSYEAKAHVELQVHRTLLADMLTALQDAEKGRT